MKALCDVPVLGCTHRRRMVHIGGRTLSIPYEHWQMLGKPRKVAIRHYKTDLYIGRSKDTLNEKAVSLYQRYSRHIMNLNAYLRTILLKGQYVPEWEEVDDRLMLVCKGAIDETYIS